MAKTYIDSKSPDSVSLLPRIFDLNTALAEFTKLSAQNTDDRTIVMVGVSFIDAVLERILLAFFPEDEPDVESLFNHDQPLGTYINKVKMIYCLGLIDKVVRNDLKFIGKIKQRFAHDLFASFEEEPIKSWCSKINWHKMPVIKSSEAASCKKSFKAEVHQLLSHLNDVVSIARGEKRMIESGSLAGTA